jgi:hypothetical protein
VETGKEKVVGGLVYMAYGKIIVCNYAVKYVINLKTVLKEI